MTTRRPAGVASAHMAQLAARRTDETRPRTPAWALSYRGGDYPHWGYTADRIGLAVAEATGTLHGLLVERGQEPFAGERAWPGGFVEQRTDADALAASMRELREEVGIAAARYVETLDTYDANGRDPRQFAGVIVDGKWIERGARIVSKAFLALHRMDDVTISPLPDQDTVGAAWHPIYEMLPWEDRRTTEGTALVGQIRSLLRAWAGAAPADQRGAVLARVQRAFGDVDTPWNEELAGDRFRLLHDAALIDEAWRDQWGQLPADLPRDLLLPGRSLAFDHRRMLADALQRLRGKMKFVPGVIAALAGEQVTLPALQQVVEAIGGRALHTANFRRAVTTSYRLVLPAGRRVTRSQPGRRPELFVFPPDIALARLESAMRLPWVPLTDQGAGPPRGA